MHQYNKNCNSVGSVLTRSLLTAAVKERRARSIPFIQVTVILRSFTITRAAFPLQMQMPLYRRKKALSGSEVTADLSDMTETRLLISVRMQAYRAL